MNLLQKTSFFFLLPFLVGVCEMQNGKRRFVHCTTGALFATSFANHSRTHDGPLYDDIDLVDKAVVLCNVMASVADALRDEVTTRAVWNCSVLAVVSAAGYLVAFTAREDRGGALGNYGEVAHAVFVHGSGALALSILSV